jgi:hypothetical protein
MLRALAMLSCLLPSLVLAQALGAPLLGKTLVINDGPGDQLDPHISGALVAYTDEASGMSQIRYHDLETGVDRLVPNSGSFDFVSDVSGSTVVFTRVSSTSSIFTYDVSTEGAVQEVAPQEGANRRGAVIGHRTVAWQDFAYLGTLQGSEIATFDLDTGVLTRLTDDALMDRTPAVSADGQVIVWSKCQTSGFQCDIWQAVAEKGGFVTRQLTGAEGEDVQPDTNGRVVVYASTRTVAGVTDRDIYWQPVGGGPEQRLALADTDTNPSISGSLLAFERLDRSAAQPNYDIYLYDLESATLYALTRTPANENLNDLSVDADGTVRVVWTAPSGSGLDVHAFSFTLPKRAPSCTPSVDERPAEEVCDAPGARPVLASVEVSRDTCEPSEALLAFAGEGSGVLCVDNGFEGLRATAGWVSLNGALEVDPSRFQQDVARVAGRVELAGDNTLEARIAGKPDSAFRVRVYGPLTDDCDSDASTEGDEVRYGVSIAPVAVEEAVATEGEPAVPGVPSAPAPVEVDGSGEPQPETSVLGEAERSPEALGGCSVGGSSLAAAGLLVIASLLLRRRQPVVVPRRGRPVR